MPQLPGPFVGTTSIFDVSDIRNINVNSEEFKEFLVVLYQQVNNIGNVINDKDHGWLSLQAYACGKQIYPEVPGGPVRGIGRKMVDFGALPNTGNKAVPHGIPFNADTRITFLYCMSNDPIAQTGLTVPYVDVLTAGALNAELDIDNTDVYIITAGDLSAYTITYVYIEFTT